MAKQVPRIIKKYPNRRLYDTEISAYVTLSELRQLVIENIDFRVIDAKTDQDITHSILMQIITEQEHSNQSMLSNQFLSQLIRLYGNSTQMLFADFLQSSMNLFMQQQQQIQERFSSATDSFQALSRDMTDNNLKMWQQVQENMMGRKSADTRPHTEEKSPPSPGKHKDHN